MSIGVIIGVVGCLGIFLLARLAAAASKPGRVYPDPGSSGAGSGDEAAAAMGLIIATSVFSGGDSGASCDAGSSGGHC